jgi:hypothetical protein
MIELLIHILISSFYRLIFGSLLVISQSILLLVISFIRSNKLGILRNIKS